MVKKVIDLESDVASLKKLFGKDKPRESYKEQYAKRLKEIDAEKEEQFYRMKLETLDKLEFGDDKFSPIKKGVKKLKDLLK